MMVVGSSNHRTKKKQCAYSFIHPFGLGLGAWAWAWASTSRFIPPTHPPTHQPTLGVYLSIFLLVLAVVGNRMYAERKEEELTAPLHVY